ncbi:MAG: tRNA threonylcarbamoyladenosine dehydratase [Clostridia bacterium]|nr:tRNA threonylcarbamoyladenosine dehydratase [Clostridia bacterium]
MLNQFSRSELLLGEEAMNKLKASRVAIFGVGGVGGYVVEGLARTGIGELDLIDNDVVSLTNINRQIIATMDTIGKYKVDVAKDRILSINPDCKVNTYKTFFLPETKDQFDFSKYDYVVDAIDTVTGKKEIVLTCYKENVPVISSMGAGNKLDPTKFVVSDIFKTSVDPLARVMRELCRKNGIKKLKVVYSTEEPVTIDEKQVVKYRLENESTVTECAKNTKKITPGSISFVPSVVGLIIAGEVIKDLAGIND